MYIHKSTRILNIFSIFCIETSYILLLNKTFIFQCVWLLEIIHKNNGIIQWKRNKLQQKLTHMGRRWFADQTSTHRTHSHTQTIGSRVRECVSGADCACSAPTRVYFFHSSFTPRALFTCLCLPSLCACATLMYNDIHIHMYSLSLWLCVKLHPRVTHDVARRACASTPHLGNACAAARCLSTTLTPYGRVQRVARVRN